MSIIIFLIVLGILIFVHELGHFIAAKKTGMRVDEFAVGFRPKIWGKRKGETEYFLGLIPIGGYVKIFGEDQFDDKSEMSEKDKKDLPRAFSNRPLWAQAVVLVAGVTFNILFAWVLLSVNFMIGANVAVSDFPEYEFENRKVLITEVIPGSPAEQAGLKPGDFIERTSAFPDQDATSETVLRGVMESEGSIDLYIEGNDLPVPVEKDYIKGHSEDKQIMGVAIDDVGEIKMLPHTAFWNGLKATYVYTVLTADALFSFFAEAFTFKADMDQVSGPVGIVGLVGDAAEKGISTLLIFTALISINLAIINILPFPALDGGRLLFVITESITKKRIKPSVSRAVNGIGFSLLILLMIVITFNDITRLF